MHGVIHLEWIKGSGRALAHKPPPKPWVARLTGLDPVHRFSREFVRSVMDYTDARPSGARGIYLYFSMSPGLYEVFQPVTWKKSRRFFIRVDEAGDWVEIERKEVEFCLENGCSA